MNVLQDLSVMECRRRLIDAELLDFDVFRETAMAGLERWKGDYNRFLEWGVFLISRAGVATDKNDDERLMYYARILQAIVDYARDNLSAEDSNAFAGRIVEELTRISHRDCFN